MLVPKYDLGMLAMDDMPTVERVAEGKRARGPMKLFQMIWDRW